METEKYTNTIHLGRKIERVRRLRGMTQAELGDLLGITKQAVSKIEQTEKFDDERLGEIASALGVTVDGLKSFNEETILLIIFPALCNLLESLFSLVHFSTSVHTVQPPFQ